MKIYLIDSYDNEAIFVYIDGILKQTYSREPLLDLPAGSVNFCGLGNYGDTSEVFQTEIYEHTAASITIDIYSNLDEDIENENFSMGYFNLRLADCPFICATCNDLSGDYCQKQWWDEYKNLQGPHINESDGWGKMVLTDVPIKVTQCSNGFTLLGGYGSIIHDTYIQLTQSLAQIHTKLRIKLNLYIIGHWVNGIIAITVDNKDFYSKSITSSNTNLFCSAQNIQSFIIQIDKVIDHQANNVVIKIISDIPAKPENDRSFGIRDVYIYYPSI